MMKKCIKVSDVEQFTVVAPGASGVTSKVIWTNVSENGNIKFEAKYEYSGLEDGWKYCPYCGNVYKPTVHPTIDKCGCDEVAETMTTLEEINEYIWASLEDVEPMTVIIRLYSGEELEFTL